MTPTQPPPAIDAVRRSLDLTPEDGAVRTVLTLTTPYDPAPAQLWPLLTRPEALAAWYGPVSGDLREGGRFQAPGGAGGTIEEVEAPHRLELGWEYGGVTTPLSLRLDPEDDGTTSLRLRHTLLIDDATFARFGPGAMAVGWEIALLGLAAATDGWRTTCLGSVPAPSPSWLAGEEGAAYVRAWSVRWAAAAVAAGVDEETARRGEQETAAAYGAASLTS